MKNKISILIFTIIFFGCSDKSVNEIESDFKNRNYEKVISSCNDLLLQDSINHEALILRGRARMMLYNFIDSEKDVRKAIRLNPKEPEYHCTLSYLMNKKGNFPLGKEYARKAIELDYDNLCGRTNLALSEMELGNYEESFKESEKALILTKGLMDESEKSPIHTNRAIIQYAWGNIEEAESEAKNALQFNSNSVEALVIFSKITAKKKNYIKAIKLLDKAIQVDRNNSLLYFNKGLTLLAMGKEKNGCEFIQKGMTVNKKYPNPQTSEMERLNKKYCEKRTE